MRQKVLVSAKAPKTWFFEAYKMSLTQENVTIRDTFNQVLQIFATIPSNVAAITNTTSNAKMICDCNKQIRPTSAPGQASFCLIV